MKTNVAQSEYKKPVLKTHGTLEKMTQGEPYAGSFECPPGGVEIAPGVCLL